jgi:hypothetical protein
MIYITDAGYIWIDSKNENVLSIKMDELISHVCDLCLVTRPRRSNVLRDRYDNPICLSS